MPHHNHHNPIHLIHSIYTLRHDWPAIRHVLGRLYWLLFPMLVLGAWAFGEALAMAARTSR